MVEALSIFGFVIGSLGFIVTVRNAIERLLSDIDAFKIQDEILEPLKGRLNLLTIHLKTWQTFWNISVRTPSDLGRAYWGEYGSNQIGKLLSHVHTQSGRVKDEFESKYGKTHITGTIRLQRLKTALFTGPIFYKHLESLEVSVKLLQDISEKYFIENVCECKEAGWRDNVEYTKTKIHLINLAYESSFASQALYDLVQHSKDYNVAFNLDHGTSSTQRQAKILEFATDCPMSYNLCVSPRNLEGSEGKVYTLQMQHREAGVLPFSNTVWGGNLRHALQRLYRDGNSSDVFVRISENTPGFAVSRYHLPRQDLTNLRTFMISTKSDFAQNLHGEFSRPERIKLAYELAECALLFLRTELFFELCSCCIYRLESDDLKTIFTVRVSRLDLADHFDSETGQPCRQRQWCEEQLLSMHIRLGVLLTEIAIGSPIVDIAFNDRKNDVEIDFDVDKIGFAPGSHFKDILRRVRREGGEDFMDAVAYCLKQGTAPRDVLHADLESFYDHVVEP